MTPHSTVTITLVSDAHGNVSARTDLAQPTPGAPLSPVQALGLDLINHCKHQRHYVLHDIKQVPALALALDATSPDMYGWAIPAEVRRHFVDLLSASQHRRPFADITELAQVGANVSLNHSFKGAAR